MRRATFTTILGIVLVLSATAGLAVSQRSQHPAQRVVAAVSAGPLHVTPLDDIPTTTTTPPPPTTVAHQTAVRASRSAVRAPRRSPGGGPCDRPSTCPQLRQCENGGSYSHGTSPIFDGAYQFADRSAWGMTPAQQDAHADEMYRQRGAAPWPTCGRFLK